MQWRNKLKIQKNDMENIVTAIENKISQYMRDMDYLGDRMIEWVEIYGEIKENSEWGQRLKKAWESAE